MRLVTSASKPEGFERVEVGLRGRPWEKIGEIRRHNGLRERRERQWALQDPHQG